jgi:hypothetical protein
MFQQIFSDERASLILLSVGFQTPRGQPATDELQVLALRPWLLLPQVVPQTLRSKAYSSVHIKKLFYDRN